MKWGHAALYHEFGGSDWQNRQHIFKDEEQMIIDRLEKKAMVSLGFGYRTGHNTSTNRSKMITHDFGEAYKNKLPFLGSYYYRSLTPTKIK
ncbi:MAG: hypothetical protein R2774_06840 [Saprospiraceae bacterium]